MKSINYKSENKIVKCMSETGKVHTKVSIKLQIQNFCFVSFFEGGETEEMLIFQCNIAPVHDTTHSCVSQASLFPKTKKANKQTENQQEVRIHTKTHRKYLTSMWNLGGRSILQLSQLY